MYNINSYLKIVSFMSKANPYSSQELKNQINKLVQAGQSIDRGNDISGSMVKLNKTMNNIQPLLSGQENYIKNFFSQQNSTSTENKDSELRRYVNRICEITINDIGQLLDVGEEYFTIEFKNSWVKIKNSFQKQLGQKRENMTQKSLIDLLFKIMNIKDFMMAEFFKSFMFRKCVLWKDLNIIEHGFVHSEKKAMNKLIENLRIQKGYIPTKPIFDWMGFDIKGRWSMNKLENPEISLVDILKITNEQIEQVFEVLRNYAHLTVEQREHDDINRNKQCVKSLRQEIQDAKNNYFQLQKKYRQAIVKDEKADVIELRSKMSQIQEELQEKDSELKKLKYQFRDSANQINTLRQKVKELQSDLNKINNQQMKKLKDLEMVQSSLNDQFSRIHKKISNMAAIFEFESDGKKSLANEIMAQEKRIQKLAELLGREKGKNRDKVEEMRRLNSIIFELSEKIGIKNKEIEHLRKSIDSNE